MILEIDGWVGFCIDEVCAYYDNMTYDIDNGKNDWDKLDFIANENVNQNFMKFIKKTSA